MDTPFSIGYVVPLTQFSVLNTNVIEQLSLTMETKIHLWSSVWLEKVLSFTLEIPS